MQTPKTENAVRWFPVSAQLARHLRMYLQNWRRTKSAFSLQRSMAALGLRAISFVHT
jgi:hypothetical protein